MDPQEQRPKKPSLLDGDAPAPAARESSPRILADMQGSPTAKAAVPKRSRRWLWPVLALVGVAVAVLLLDLGGLFDGSAPVSARKSATADAGSEPAASPGAAEQVPQVATSAAAPAAAASSQPQQAAVITPDDSANAPAVAAASAPAPSSTASKQASAELNQIFTPKSAASSAPVPGAAAPRATAASGGSRRAASSRPSGDSDVDLLTVLMKHVEAGGQPRTASSSRSGVREKILQVPSNTGSLESDLRHCPPANTDAGIACRQRVCAGHQGQSPACPKSMPDS